MFTKGQPTQDCHYVALVAQLGEHCTRNIENIGLNPVQSLKFFTGHFSSSVMAAVASVIMSTFIATVGHLLPLAFI